MLSCDPPPAIHAFLQTFRTARHRDPRLDDLPVWRTLELLPHPANVNFHRTYLPALLSLTTRLAQLQHPPIHNDPLWSSTLATQETHIGHWEAMCQRIRTNTPDSAETQFGTLFHNVHRRYPTEADVPTWKTILLTEDIPVQRPLTREEYTTAAHRVMLRALHTREEEARPVSQADTQSNTPETYTPLSSPPRQRSPSPNPPGRDSPQEPPAASPLNPPRRDSRHGTPVTPSLPSMEGEASHRTPVTTSPNLGDKRRGRTQGDRTAAQSTQKAQLLAVRRSTRGQAPAATESYSCRSSCCFSGCQQSRPPFVDNLTCAHTHRPMHLQCSAPANSDSVRYCIDCQAQQNPC